MDLSFGPRSFLFNVTPPLTKFDFCFADDSFIQEHKAAFPETDRKALKETFLRLTESVHKRYFRSVIGFLDNLIEITKADNSQLSWLFNKDFKLENEHEGSSLVARTIEHVQEELFIKEILKLALPLNEQYSVTEDYSKTICGLFIDRQKPVHLSTQNSAAHLAVLSRNLDALTVLHQLGLPLDQTNSAGLTPLSLAISRYSMRNGKENEILKYLIKNSLIDTESPASLHPAILLCMQSQFPLLNQIASRNFNAPIDAAQTYLVFDKADRRQANFKELIQEICDLSKQVKYIIKKHYKDINPQTILDQAIFLFQKNLNIYELYLYLKSFVDLSNPNKSQDSKAFVLLSRAVYSKYHPKDISKILDIYERKHDLKYFSTDLPCEHDYNDAEIMLCLANPNIIHNPNSPSISVITRALTSPYRYMNYDKEHLVMQDGDWMIMQNWQRTAQITHGFKRWEFVFASYKSDAGFVTLAENFGFRKHLTAPEVFSVFGNFYHLSPSDLGLKYTTDLDPGVLSKFKKNSLAIACQAFIAIHDPELGTVLVRNSSLTFGRTSLKHFAYYDPIEEAGSGLSGSNLCNLTPEIIESRFAPLLAREINGVPESPYPKQIFPNSWHGLQINCADNILILLAQLDSVLESMESWCFDTNSKTAFQISDSADHRELLGAYKSKGFSNFVDSLEYFYTKLGPKKCPHLALVEPYSVPINTFPFLAEALPGQEMTELSTLKVDQFLLEVLRDLADGKVDLDFFRASNLLNFFQTAIDNEANLILLDP